MRRLLLVLSILALTVSGASAQTIGVFFDPNATTCSGVIMPGTPATLYVLAIPGGATPEGFTTSEFRITGMPAGWTTTYNHNPNATVAVGDPVGPVGAVIGFPLCETGSIVLLYTLQVTANSAVTDHYLTVEKRNPPSTKVQCPVLTRCDSPIWTPVCASGGQAIINPTGASCTVGLEPSSWTRVKGLYDRP